MMDEEGNSNEINPGDANLSRDHPHTQQFVLPEIGASPDELPTGYEWCTCDLNDDRTCYEIGRLLALWIIHPHVLYGMKYLRWSLCPPGYFADWHVGVRKVQSRKIAAFVSAVPTRIRVQGNILVVAHLRYLCVDIPEREKIPPAILSDEISRRVNMMGIAGRVSLGERFPPAAPKMVSRVWKRHLDPSKMEDLCYKTPRPGMPFEQVRNSCTLQDFIGTPGIREMRPSDALSVYSLLGDYLGQFAIAPVFTEEDVSHWLVPREGVLDSFVIEKTSGGRRVITDFFSYTRFLQTSGDVSGEWVARLFYYVHDPTTTLPRLMRDALLTAKYCHCRLFVADGFMANLMFLEELKFERSCGQVQYSLKDCGIDCELHSSKVGISLPL